MKPCRGKFNSELVIMLFFLLTPLIEILNSNLLMNFGGDSVLGKIYRFFYILAMFVILFKDRFRKKSLNKIIVFISIITFSATIKGICFNTNFIETFFIGSKYLLPVMTFIVLEELNNKNKLKNDFFYSVMYKYSIILPFTYILPLILKMGYYQYSNHIGYKGLNYQINDINIIFGCTSLFLLYLFIKTKHIKYATLTLLNVFCLLYMQTKTSIIIVALSLLVSGLQYTKGRNRLIKLVIQIMVMILIISVISTKFQDQIIGYFARLNEMYVYMTKQGYSFFEFLTTTRSSRLSQIQYVYDFDKLSGYLKCLVGLPEKQFLNSEMDFFDIFFRFGIGMLLFILIFFIRPLIIAIFNYTYSKDIEDAQLLCIYSVMILFSAFGGHVLMSAYSGAVLALVGYEIIRRYHFIRIKQGEVKCH
ncbi:hypothetical protein Ami103574_07160 [Aminipila butyrica]|uniref:O-antigen ligase like membrane protein n=1 Tax=Aminipila butyrica TaxID=433296 RepID=A0A858BSZ4_9FIRM|nr:O-antigen ligase family protein [Aminipila butyrica]QIB69111.1 hypothetical protein Ami103574_07160 [Aminipila butyrica]